MRKLALSDEILLTIEKPARYIGNEVNVVEKEFDAVDVTVAMCFPDVYEIGMSHLGIQILYDMFNRWEDTYCDRVYSPWVDLDKIMREQNIPSVRSGTLIFWASHCNMRCVIPMYCRSLISATFL